MRHWIWVYLEKKYTPYTRTGKYFRKLPVPHTKCIRGGRGYFRYPKTLQELRELYAFDRDEDMKFYGVKIRRRRISVPTAWDDVGRNDFENHSWKRHRKTQWKPK